MQALEEQVALETQTATGIGADFDLDPAMQSELAGQPPIPQEQ
jgi:hypothetical protein